jgi:putative ABC transport system permease protein
VMPEGFRFPVSHHYWIPLVLNPARHDVGGGPPIRIFGRLTAGATLAGAQTELTALGQRMAAAYPATHEHLRPRIMPYTHPYIGIDNAPRAWMIRGFQIFISLLLVVVSVNVAILVYARTATRTGEIAVRSALGASRTRVVTQLLIEALVLSGVAALVGLALAALGLARLESFAYDVSQGMLPFWWDFGLSGGLVAYVLTLTILAGAIVGVLPALKATGRRVQGGLQELSARGSKMQLGRTWTLLIVAQVAVAVAVLPFALHFAGQNLRRATAQPGYAADEVLRTRLVLEQTSSDQATSSAQTTSSNQATSSAQTTSSNQATSSAAAVQARFAARVDEIMRRVEAEPVVAGVTFASPLPGFPFALVEPEGGAEDWALISRTDVDMFAVLDVPIVAGRDFVESDGRERTSVIVNRVFAEKLVGGGNVVGRRIRLTGRGVGAVPGTGQTGPWIEIVGVVEDFGIQLDLERPHARLYEPVARADITPGATLSVRVRGTAPAAFAGRLREIAAAVDPTVQLHQVRTADTDERNASRMLRFAALTTLIVVGSVVLLSAAGIHAMMSFTVARRRREIGIRCALGADPRRLLTGIFRRASAQLGTGVAVGLLLAVVIRGPIAGRGMLLLPVVAAVMMVVGLLAALGPARRGLAVQPTETLREE